jgi:3-oxoadipate enol-lactonase
MTTNVNSDLPRSGHAQTSFCELAYVDRGTGPILVLWPSIMMDADMFEGQIEALSQHFRIIAIDPPGHGKSGSLHATFTLDACGDAVIGILDALGEKSAIFAGNSWGGMVALNIAARYPNYARAIIVMNSAATPVSLAHRIEYGMMPTAIKLLGIATPLIAIALRSFLGATAHRDRPDLRAFITRKLKQLDRNNIVHVVNSILLGRADQRPLLPQITCPVLIIGGKEDRVFGPSEQILMHQAIPQSDLRMVAAGHFAPLEAVEAVNEEIIAFTSQLAAPS